MIRRPPRSTLFPYTSSSDLHHKAFPVVEQTWRSYVAHKILRPSPHDRSILRSEEHTSELQSHSDLVCRLLLEKKKKKKTTDDKNKNKNIDNEVNRTRNSANI